jgi:hypothetical protein
MREAFELVLKMSHFDYFEFFKLHSLVKCSVVGLGTSF